MRLPATLSTAAIIAIVALARPLLLAAQSADTRFTAAQATRDLAILVRGLKDLHPGLYRYISPAAYDSAVATTRDRIANGGTRAELFIAFTRLAAAVRCGHTWTNPLNQADALQAELFARADKLPFRLELVDDRFLVTSSIADGVSPGDELLAVDGVAAADIVREMLPLVRADGSSDDKRRAGLSHLFGLSAMDMYWPLVHPPRNGRYLVLVQRAGARGSEERLVTAVAPAYRDSVLKARGTVLPSKEWTFAIRGDTGFMSIPTFVAPDDFDWKAWYERSFAALNAARTPNLVIDIRQNEGGNDGVFETLLSHFLRAPYAKPVNRFESAYERVPYALARYLLTWDYGFFDRTGKVTKTDGRNWIINSRAVEADTIFPHASPYRGRVFLLVGPENSSGGYLMARFAKESKAATLVGRPTGGNLRGLNGYELTWLVLPASGVAVDIPLVSAMPTVPQPDAPVTPDVLVERRFDDARRGVDADLGAVRKLISPARAKGARATPARGRA